MPCVSPDGKPTESGLMMLRAIGSGSSSPEDIATVTGMALFRVRSGIRDMVLAGFVAETDGTYVLTGQGTEAL
jgi:predicted transcriptional regulator